ncbi:MAG: pantoate--beta-alanine ligase, partial [Elusimicrobia bacterium]|nr:pantoate--beta-alanine ligase [Elusimicrobiota bacterium]
VGFVPTMGALHEGHLSLIERACRENNKAIVSLFVNPLQFSPKEDYQRYPRPFAKDSRLCRQAGVNLLFHPTVQDLYPQGFNTQVEVKGWSDILCGTFRPGHFKGVATVVLKLLHLAQPDRAYFGEKDFQQLQIIRKMTEDLNLPVRTIGCPTIRQKDGLALSSRNVYLKPGERIRARRFQQILRWGVQMARGQKRSSETENIMRKELLKIPGLKLDYVRVVDSKTLDRPRTLEGRLRILAAVWLGKTRLIDNVPLICKN